MRYVAAYLLAVLGGKTTPNGADIEKILGSVGIEADQEKLKLVLKSLEGKSIPDLIATGREKLCTISVGTGAAAAAPSATAAAPAAEEKKDSKKEEVKEESESDEDMGFTLFD